MDDLISKQKVLNTLDFADNALDEERTVENYKELLTECIKVLSSDSEYPNKCDDLISRQAVMECFKKWRPYMATRLCEFEKELTAIPSVENKGEWIPVSERLPENNKNVLATDGLDVFIAWHNPEKEKWYSFDELFDEQYPILAWQLLPEPWEGEKENG